MRGLAILAAALLLALPAQGQTRWVGSWATSEQVPEPRNALAPHDLDDATLRQTVHLSLGGRMLRLKLSNAFGTAPLHVAAVHIAHPTASGSSVIVAGSDTVVRFNGADEVTIPAGAEYASDAVALPVAAGADVAITLYFDTGPNAQTSHPGSRTTSYLVHGNHVADVDLPGARTFDHWFTIAGMDVPSPGAAVSVIGDSITDGRGSTTNANDRWTDALARRLLAAQMPVGVLNHGIGGGHVLLDGLGPNVLARFDRDVLAQTRARWLIVFEAINDIGTFDRDGTKPQGAHDALVADIERAYDQMITRAHDAGLKIYGATITPFMDCEPYRPKPVTEADRVALNRWIRRHFDAVLDFDQVARDPARPDHLARMYDSGDGLHLSPAGYRALADSIPLSLFKVGK